jgi:hypothetical protein
MTSTTETEALKRKERGAARVKLTGEIFTPMDLCLKMVRSIPEEKLKDPTTTYLDNSCGDGNFLVALFNVLTEDYGHPSEQVLDTQIFGVDLMPDNIAEAKRRLGLTPDRTGWDHIVCADALAYDYGFEPQSQTSMVEEAGVR